jgi:hypothetical protein
MPPLPVINDVYRVALEWVDAAGRTAVNVLHVHAPALTPSAIATAFSDNVTDNMLLSVVDDATVDRYAITPLDGVSATEVFTAANWTGGGSGDQIPQVAGLVSLRTPLRGREHRGRIYLPYGAEGGQSDGRWIGDTLTAPGPAWTTFATVMDGAGATLVVASYKLSTATAVSSLNWESHTATQRRRQERVRG